MPVGYVFSYFHITPRIRCTSPESSGHYFRVAVPTVIVASLDAIHVIVGPLFGARCPAPSYTQRFPDHGLPNPRQVLVPACLSASIPIMIALVNISKSIKGF